MNPGRPLRVVSLNTWKGEGDYHARLIAMIRGLRELQPDVVLLQESLRAPSLQMDTGISLARALSLQAEWLPLRRKLRNICGETVDSWSGLCLLSRLPVLDSRGVDMDSDPADGERSAQLVTLAASGLRLVIANLHLSHLDGAGALRRRQLGQVVAAMNGLAADIHLLGGDFNAACGELELDSLSIFGRPLQDLRARTGSPYASTLVQDDRCIDHFLAAGGEAAQPLAVSSLRLQTPVDASDHLAIVIDWKIFRPTAD
jgi:endonuclease/exonuclease/phosphatase family metal-dependent hydrolase